MPIVLILFVTAACLPIAWPSPPAGVSILGAMNGTLGFSLLPVMAAAVTARRIMTRLARNPADRYATSRQFARLRRLVLLLNVACFLADLVVFGWGSIIWHLVTRDGILLPFAELLVPSPFLLTMAVNWLVYYPAEKALHVAAGISRPYPGWFVHWATHVRRFAIFVFFPAALFACQQTVIRYLPKSWQDSPWLIVAGFTTLLGILIVMPVAMVRVLGMRSLPAGPRRDRFEALAKRLNVRFRDILFWPTHGTLATAVMIGVLPRLRYCAFSDRLLEELTDDELDAVLGHEIGHVRHGHVPFYLLFFILSSIVVSSAVALGIRSFGVGDVLPTGFLAELLIAIPLVVLGVYLFLVFGWLSRRCERQADLFGARAVSCGRTDCAVHGPDDFPDRGLAPMCPTGIRVFVNALQQVAYVNGLDPIGGEHPSLLHATWAWVRAWQHGPIPARIAFLRSLLLDPRRERAAQAKIAFGRWGLIAGLVAATILIGSTIGWTAVWTAL